MLAIIEATPHSGMGPVLWPLLRHLASCHAQVGKIIMIWAVWGVHIMWDWHLFELC